MCERPIERNQQPQFIQWVYKSFFFFLFDFFSLLIENVVCLMHQLFGKDGIQNGSMKNEVHWQATSQVSIPKIVQVLWSQIINRERKGYEMIRERKTWGRSVFDSESIFLCCVHKESFRLVASASFVLSAAFFIILNFYFHFTNSHIWNMIEDRSRFCWTLWIWVYLRLSLTHSLSRSLFRPRQSVNESRIRSQCFFLCEYI